MSDVLLVDTPRCAINMIFDNAQRGVIFMRNVVRNAWVVVKT
jgi:hypothetical protein